MLTGFSANRSLENATPHGNTSIVTSKLDSRSTVGCEAPGACHGPISISWTIYVHGKDMVHNRSILPRLSNSELCPLSTLAVEGCRSFRCSTCHGCWIFIVFQSLRVNPRLSRKSRWPGEEYPTKSQRSPKCEISGAWSEELQSLNPEILWSSLFSFVNSDMKADFQQVCLPWSSCASGVFEVRRTAWAPVPLCGNGSRGLGYLISWRGNRWDLVVGQYLEKASMMWRKTREWYTCLISVWLTI